MAVDDRSRLQHSLPVVDESWRSYEHPLYHHMVHVPGLSVGLGALDQLLTWGLANSLWIFPMATSCCGIELMAAAASRVDLDRMGTIVRASPRQADVMVVAGTVSVKMAPRIKKLWDQMPEPKWCIAMGSCAISGDFYRELYAVVPGVDTFMPVDVYVPGCPPNPEALMDGLLRLQEKVRLQREGTLTPPEPRSELIDITRPSIPRLGDGDRDPGTSAEQTAEAMRLSAPPREQPSTVEARDDGAAAPPSDGALETLLGGHDATQAPKDGPLVVSVAHHLALASALKERGYRQLVYVVASHWPAGRGRSGPSAGEAEHFEVAYGLRTVGPGSRLAAWSVRIDPGADVPSLSGLFAGADWQEREQWDLVGVTFAGHPDLRRLMMPEDWEGHPLRKDYPADKARAPWR